MQTEFFMPMIPPKKTHQEKELTIRNGKPVIYEPAELKAVRMKLRGNLAKWLPDSKYSGPVRMVTKWCFPLIRGRSDGEYKTTKPDTDNLQKMLKDEMEHVGFWDNDAIVASEITEKFWAKIPGIYICISELGGDRAI